VATVVMLVVLRLSLGCHFLYEGLWKIANRKTFSAEPFLAEAKGPLAPLFYAMVPDIDGTERLTYEKDAQGLPRLTKGKPVVKAESTLAAWQALKDRAVEDYRMTEEQQAEADKLLKRYQAMLKEYLDDNAEEIVAYLGSLSRFQAEKEQGGNNAPYYKKRMWDRRQDLRKEVKVWLAYIDTLGDDFKNDLWNLLDDQRQARGYFPAGWNPFAWPQMEQINFAVTYGLTAIGLCLMLGLFTRPAALGGAAFMVFVILTQPNWPTIYPPAGPEGGHALIINKDFVEMVALLLLATTAAGRWGGLDAFLSRWLPFPLGCRKRQEIRSPNPEIRDQPQ
jgi:uncharacterized membrane protein YphA (DoxX/SURF4 family)